MTVLELYRAHARDAGGRDGRARGALAGVSVGLDASVHAFFGAPEDGTLALVDVLGGARRPTRGRVTLLGKDPARSPALRAHIGCLAPEPRLPDASTVREAIGLAARARGQASGASEGILDALGLSSLATRSPRSLAFAEERAVELALALSTPEPALLVLHEPLLDVACARLDLVSARLAEAASRGACVVVTTSSAADAASLTDHVFVLERGVIAREARGAGPHLRAEVTLRAYVRPTSDGRGARELCAALALRPEVCGVSFAMPTEGKTNEAAADHAAVVELRGASAQACAAALIGAAVELDVEVEAFRELTPRAGDPAPWAWTAQALRETPIARQLLREAPPARPTSPPGPDPSKVEAP